MNKQERIKAGYTGIQTAYTKDGRKIVLNFDDTENLVILTPEEQKILEKLREKSRKPGFKGYTKEEEKIFSDITGIEEEDDD